VIKLEKIIIVGAGIGGLVSAGLLAQRGYKVTLLERSPILGGRSHILTKDGFTMPYGAHAILAPKAEHMKSIFKELDIKLNFNKPSISKFKLFSDGKVISSPLGTGALTSPAIQGFVNHFVFLKTFLQMVKAKPNFDTNLSVQDWIRKNIKDSSIAKVMRAYAALTVYDGALDLYSMNAFAEHTNMLYSTSQPLGYAAYEDLLEQLKRSLLKQGGEIHLGCDVKELVIDNGKAVGVVIKDQTIAADAVVLNLPPQALSKLAERTPLSEELNSYVKQTSQYVYVYDVMLSEQIRKDITNLLDLDDSVYINDYSLNVPGSAPKGSQLLTCLKFLTRDEQQNDSHAECSQKSVETILDAVYAGWRNRLVGTRIVNKAMVNGIARYTSNKSLPFVSKYVSSLYFVGDSTAGRGGLGLPAYDSAWAVAGIISKTARNDKAIFV
jgi:phytoene dehydrogenase-like protein